MSGVAKIEPLSPNLGAIVEGVDRKAPVSAAAVDTIMESLLKYKVLFFRGQDLELAEQREFACNFGELLVEPLTRNVDGQPGMTTVSNVPYFHSDHMHMADPPKFSMLQMKVLPPAGGDTMFADQVSGYEALSDPMKAFLDPLSVLHVSRDANIDIKQFYGSFFGEDLSEERLADIRAALVPHSHPLVRYIPETGRKNYWLCKRFTKSIEQLSPPESEAVLQFLFHHQLQPQFVLRWRWAPGDLVFWDHRTTLHSAVADFGNAPRSGQRASIAGGRPLRAPDGVGDLETLVAAHS